MSRRRRPGCDVYDAFSDHANCWRRCKSVASAHNTGGPCRPFCTFPQETPPSCSFLVAFIQDVVLNSIENVQADNKQQTDYKSFAWVGALDHFKDVSYQVVDMKN